MAGSLEGQAAGLSFLQLVGCSGQALFQWFFQRFSKTVAHRRRETRNFFQVVLGTALEAEDWPGVRVCRAKMEEMDI
jgi:hypothetical protein